VATTCRAPTTIEVVRTDRSGASAGLRPWPLLIGLACACSAAVESPPDRLIPADVVFAPVEERELTDAVHLLGRVVRAPGALVEVTSDRAGRVRDLAPVGATVAVGDVLARIVGEATRPPPPARAALTLASEEAERLTRLAREGLTPWADANAARRRAAALRSDLHRPPTAHAVRAATAGRVLEHRTTVGRRVTAGDPLLAVLDPDRLEIEAQLTELSLERVGEGSEAHIELVSLGARRLSARVDRPPWQLPDHPRRFAIAVVPTDPEVHLTLGATAAIELTTGAVRRVVVIPTQALVDGPTGPSVLIRAGDGVARRAVAARVLNDGWLEIARGLEPGAEIVVEGAQLLVAPALAGRARPGDRAER